MAMQERLTITLDEAKILAACEAFVAPRLQPDEIAHARILGMDELTVTVTVSKKRIRKSKNGPSGAA